MPNSVGLSAKISIDNNGVNVIPTPRATGYATEKSLSS